MSLPERLREQHKDALCTAICSHINREEELSFHLDDRGIFIPVVEAFEQIVISYSFKSRVLHLSHYSQLSGHPG